MSNKISSAADGFHGLLRDLPVLTGHPPPFDPDEAPCDPVLLFRVWLIAAIEAGVREPHVMVLSTVDQPGHPSSRMLILKDLDERGWAFASTAAGRKGRELTSNPYASLCFYWPEQARQIRVRGIVVPASTEESVNDFRGRSAASQAACLIGRQSQPLLNLAELTDAVSAARKRLKTEPQLIASDWTLYILRPLEVEFWQGDPQRLHLRLQYSRAEIGQSWRRQRLWP